MQCKECKYYQHVKMGKLGADRGICLLEVKGKVFVYGNCKTCAKCEIKVVNVMNHVEGVKASDVKDAKVKNYMSKAKKAAEMTDDNFARDCSWKMHRCPNCRMAFYYGIPEYCPYCGQKIVG